MVDLGDYGSDTGHKALCPVSQLFLTHMFDSTAAVVRGRDVHRVTGLPHVRPPLYLTQGIPLLVLSDLLVAYQ